MKPTQPRDRYPWFVRPLPGHFHAVEFGTVYRSNGSLPNMQTGCSLSLNEQFSDVRIHHAIKADRREMHVHHDGTIVDVYGKQGATVRKDKAELLD